MDLLFVNARLERLCACIAELEQRLGPHGASAAAAHLASLRAASCLEDFRYLPGRCRERRGQFSLDLPDGAHLDFEAVGQSDEDGRPDWFAIKSIRILRIAEG